MTHVVNDNFRFNFILVNIYSFLHTVQFYLSYYAINFNSDILIYLILQVQPHTSFKKKKIVITNVTLKTIK